MSENSSDEHRDAANRLMHGLREVEADLSGDESEAVSGALSHVRTYREAAEGI